MKQVVLAEGCLENRDGIDQSPQKSAKLTAN
jgi:hypothetical protein